jgi:hypothetical protein
MNLSFCRMYVHWREREHEDVDILVDEDLAAMAALRQCDLWKFFRCPFMRAQPRLLNALVDYWHPDVESFMIEGQSLTPTTKDIYFFPSLLRRGDPCWVGVIFFACVCVGASDMTTASDDPSSSVLCVMCTRRFPRGVPGGGRYAPPWLRAAFENGQ